MSAYVISAIEQFDAKLLARYRLVARPSVEQYGGEYLARGGQLQVVEGSWKPQSLVIIRFSHLARAQEWYASPEYAVALEIGHEAFSRALVFVDGLSDAAGSEGESAPLPRAAR